MLSNGVENDVVDFLCFVFLVKLVWVIVSVPLAVWDPLM
jgi:hypothetical protein